jgi:hypothetical protein
MKISWLVSLTLFGMLDAASLNFLETVFLYVLLANEYSVLPLPSKEMPFRKHLNRPAKERIARLARSNLLRADVILQQS